MWTVGADGSGLRRLTPACAPGAEIPKCAADDSTPAWSPDGKHIALQRASGALRGKGEAISVYKDALVVTDADGRHARTLVWVGPWRGDVHAPSWSPDGKRLVFIGDHIDDKTNGTGCNCAGLYVVNLDGTHTCAGSRRSRCTLARGRLVAGMDDPLRDGGGRRHCRRYRGQQQPVHDPPRWECASQADALHRVRARRGSELLAGRDVDRDSGQPRRCRGRLARRLCDERGRDGARAGHAHAQLRGSPRLGSRLEAHDLVRPHRHARQLQAGRGAERGDDRCRRDDRRRLADALDAVGASGSGSSISTDSTGGMSSVVGIR